MARATLKHTTNRRRSTKTLRLTSGSKPISVAYLENNMVEVTIKTFQFAPDPVAPPARVGDLLAA